MDTNLNIAQCLRSQSNFGETIVHNICNNTLTTVPWGSADWAVAAGVIAFTVTACFVFFALGKSVLSGF